MSHQLLIFGLVLLAAARFNWWQAGRLVSPAGKSSSLRSPSYIIDTSTQKVVQFILGLSAFCTAIAISALFCWLRGDRDFDVWSSLFNSIFWGLFLSYLYRFWFYRSLTKQWGRSPIFKSSKKPRLSKRRRHKTLDNSADDVPNVVGCDDDSSSGSFLGLFGGESGGGDSDGGGFWESFGGEGGGECGGSDFGGGESGGGECGGDF